MVETLAVTAVSTHSRLKAAGSSSNLMGFGVKVSTHSRLKAAGWVAVQDVIYMLGFNTQPPEGGWLAILGVIK